MVDFIRISIVFEHETKVSVAKDEPVSCYNVVYVLLTMVFVCEGLAQCTTEMTWWLTPWGRRLTTLARTLTYNCIQ